MTYIEHDHVYSAHSKRELETCHTDLVALSRAILPYWDHKVNEGHRPQHEQDLHYLEGRSNVQWPNSKHNKYPSEAIHMLPYVGGRFIGWEGREAMYHWYAFAGFVIGMNLMLVKQGIMDYHVRWGGDWDSDWNFAEHSLRDLAHWELE